MAFIDIHTVAAIWSEDKAILADTLEAAIFVDAHPIETHVGCGTFIVIHAVLSIWGEFKAGIADTLEAAISIDTSAVPT